MVGMIDDFTACGTINIRGMGVWWLMGCDFGSVGLDGGTLSGRCITVSLNDGFIPRRGFRLY